MSWFEEDYSDVERRVSRTSSESASAHGSGPLTVQPKMAVHLRPADMMQELSTAWTDGLRFGDFNDDQGTHWKVDWAGISMNAKALSFKQKATTEMDAKRYKEALSASTQAIEFALKIIDNGEQLGELFYQRAKIHFSMKKNEKAKEDVLISVRCCPVYMPAVIFLAEVLEAVGDFDEAFVLCARASQHYVTTDDTTAELVQHAVKLSSKAHGGLGALAELEFKDTIWGKVVASLATEGSWSSVRILLMGTDDIPALVTSFDASKVQLSGLLGSCRETSWKEWGQKLALLLIRKGANHQTLCAKAKYPLHVALQLALKTDTFELLKWLLANKAGTNISSTDENGNNLLHQACRSKTSARTTAVRLLLNHKVDASAKNNDGKIPLDYLDKQDKDYDALRKHMGINTDAAPSKESPAGSLVPVTTTASGLGSVVSTPGLLFPTQIILDFEHLKTWTKTRVQKWLESCNLGQHKKKFKDVDGPLLYEMKMMQNVAPEMFYKVLEQSLQLPLVDLLKVSYSLRHIPQAS